MKRFVRKLVVKLLTISGWSDYAASSMYYQVMDDFLHTKETNLSQKIWAYCHGFLSYRVPYYNLTEDNYQDYLSDFDYYRLHPINGPFSRWIDDKLTMRYILAPFSRYLPEYYYHIYKDEILRLPDCPDGFMGTIPDVLNLLKSKGSLAAKPIAGAGGHGFYKLGYDGQTWTMNDRPSSEQELKAFLFGNMSAGEFGYILTGYLQSHQDLRRIWNKTPWTLRLLVLRKKGQAPYIAFSFLRIGTSITGLVDNIGMGGLLCMVDLETGIFSDAKIHFGNQVSDCRYHPDSKVLLEGTIPRWTLIKEKILEISSYIPQIRYMGYDLIITEDGFKIIEINSLPGNDYLQLVAPFLKNEQTGDFFNPLLAEM